jgi:hypothetical protein
MVRNLETCRMETGKISEGSRREAASGVWTRLRGRFATAAVVLMAGCAPAAAQNQAETAQQPPALGNLVVLDGGDTHAGQVEIGMRIRVEDGETINTSMANIAPGNYSFRWFIFQEIGRGRQLLLNPRYRESDQPRFIGIVMRDIALTDGTRGDFVVRMARDSRMMEIGEGDGVSLASRASIGAAVERDGRVRPENALLQLQRGTFAPVPDSAYYSHRDETSGCRMVAMVTFVEYGPATPIVVVEPVLAASRPDGRFAASVVPASITDSRSVRMNGNGTSETVVTFTANSTVVTDENGTVSLSDFEARHGRLNPAYCWFVFQDIQPHTGMLLLNPQYQSQPQERYVGMLLRGVMSTDGETGDFVVRVRRVDGTSASLQWAPMMEQDGRVRPENILFRMRTGTLEPELDGHFLTNLRSASFIRESNRVSVVEYGHTTPVVVVSVSDKLTGTEAPVPASRISPRR